jgi:hypothetical protein
MSTMESAEARLPVRTAGILEERNIVIIVASRTWRPTRVILALRSPPRLNFERCRYFKGWPVVRGPVAGREKPSAYIKHSTLVTKTVLVRPIPDDSNFGQANLKPEI